MSMVGQSESNDIFVSGVKVKELMITGSSILLFLFQWENKNVDLFTMGSLIFGINNKNPSDLLCPATLIFAPPYPTVHVFQIVKHSDKKYFDIQITESSSGSRG